MTDDAPPSRNKRGGGEVWSYESKEIRKLQSGSVDADGKDAGVDAPLFEVPKQETMRTVPAANADSSPSVFPKDALVTVVAADSAPRPPFPEADASWVARLAEPGVDGGSDSDGDNESEMSSVDCVVEFVDNDSDSDLGSTDGSEMDEGGGGRLTPTSVALDPMVMDAADAADPESLQAFRNKIDELFQRPDIPCTLGAELSILSIRVESEAEFAREGGNFRTIVMRMCERHQGHLRRFFRHGEPTDEQMLFQLAVDARTKRHECQAGGPTITTATTTAATTTMTGATGAVLAMGGTPDEDTLEAVRRVHSFFVLARPAIDEAQLPTAEYAARFLATVLGDYRAIVGASLKLGDFERACEDAPPVLRDLLLQVAVTLQDLHGAVDSVLDVLDHAQTPAPATTAYAVEAARKEDTIVEVTAYLQSEPNLDGPAPAEDVEHRVRAAVDSLSARKRLHDEINPAGEDGNATPGDDAGKSNPQKRQAVQKGATGTPQDAPPPDAPPPDAPPPDASSAVLLRFYLRSLRAVEPMPANGRCGFASVARVLDLTEEELVQNCILPQLEAPSHHLWGASELHRPTSPSQLREDAVHGLFSDGHAAAVTRATGRRVLLLLGRGYAKPSVRIFWPNDGGVASEALPLDMINHRDIKVDEMDIVLRCTRSASNVEHIDPVINAGIQGALEMLHEMDETFSRWVIRLGANKQGFKCAGCYRGLSYGEACLMVFLFTRWRRDHKRLERFASFTGFADDEMFNHVMEAVFALPGADMMRAPKTKDDRSFVYSDVSRRALAEHRVIRTNDCFDRDEKRRRQTVNYDAFRSRVRFLFEEVRRGGPTAHAALLASKTVNLELAVSGDAQALEGDIHQRFAAFLEVSRSEEHRSRRCSSMDSSGSSSSTANLSANGASSMGSIEVGSSSADSSGTVPNEKSVAPSPAAKGMHLEPVRHSVQRAFQKQAEGRAAGPDPGSPALSLCLDLEPNCGLDMPLDQILDLSMVLDPSASPTPPLTAGSSEMPEPRRMSESPPLALERFMMPEGPAMLPQTTAMSDPTIVTGPATSSEPAALYVARDRDGTSPLWNVTEHAVSDHQILGVGREDHIVLKGKDEVVGPALRGDLDKVPLFHINDRSPDMFAS